MVKKGEWRFFWLLVGAFGLVAGAWAQQAAGGAEGSPPPSAAGEEQISPASLLDGLNATLWHQASVEYRALCLQTFKRAKGQLDRALADPQWSAAFEQTGSYADLAPAVILDVDETVLDNSPYQARRILSGLEYDSGSFAAWAEEKKARPLAGAVAFTQYADDRGVAVFYVTNRRVAQEKATLQNLQRYGFPVQKGLNSLLMQGEKGWTSDKTARRRLIAQNYRILLLVGDDFNDFVTNAKGIPTERDALFSKVADYFGDRWIILPNPGYGSWHGALIGYNYGLPRGVRLHRLFGALDDATDGSAP